jgi:predicted RecA/RadA family phage recombinase
MAIAEEVSEGARIPFVAAAAVTAGTPVVLDDIVVVPHTDFEAGADATGAIEGLFRIAKTTTAFPTTPGTLCYYDEADKNVNADNTNNKLIGIAVETTVAADTTVLIKLKQPTA